MAIYGFMVLSSKHLYCELSPLDKGALIPPNHPSERLQLQAQRVDVRGQRLRAEVGFLRGGSRGSKPPSHQLGGLGEHCKLPLRGSGWSPVRKRFLPARRYASAGNSDRMKIDL